MFWLERLTQDIQELLENTLISLVLVLIPAHVLAVILVLYVIVLGLGLGLGLVLTGLGLVLTGTSTHSCAVSDPESLDSEITMYGLSHTYW